MEGAVWSGVAAEDLNNGKAEVELFSPTPLSRRWLVSELASQGDGRVGGKRLMCIDFTMVFLYGCVDRDVHMELPDEDARKQLGRPA